MKRMRLLLILLLLPSLAVGADALLSWDPPTEYEDGTAACDVGCKITVIQ